MKFPQICVTQLSNVYPYLHLFPEPLSRDDHPSKHMQHFFANTDVSSAVNYSSPPQHVTQIDSYLSNWVCADHLSYFFFGVSYRHPTQQPAQCM
jgi:hypothetical protein